MCCAGSVFLTMSICDMGQKARWRADADFVAAFHLALDLALDWQPGTKRVFDLVRRRRASGQACATVAACLPSRRPSPECGRPCSDLQSPSLVFQLVNVDFGFALSADIPPAPIPHRWRPRCPRSPVPSRCDGLSPTPRTSSRISSSGSLTSHLPQPYSFSLRPSDNAAWLGRYRRAEGESRRRPGP